MPSRRTQPTIFAVVGCCCALLGFLSWIGYGTFATKGIHAVISRPSQVAYLMASYADGFRVGQLVLNESRGTMSAVRVSHVGGERRDDQIPPGHLARWELQSQGESDLTLSYRDSNGSLRRCGDLCYFENGYRGVFEIHVRDDGMRLVDGIYPGVVYWYAVKSSRPKVERAARCPCLPSSPTRRSPE
jgi:hypothetical protein